MRMWMLDPKLLCNKHLLGEHGELHKHLHNFQKKHSMTGRISPIVLIEPASMKLRHDLLAIEMVLRGMNHKSPYGIFDPSTGTYNQPDLSYLPDWQVGAKADIGYNISDLCARCEACRERIQLREVQLGKREVQLGN